MRRTTFGRTRQHSAHSNLLRSGGIGAILAGVLFAAWGYLDQNNAPLYFDVMAYMLAAIVPTLFVVGLATLLARYAGRATRLAQTGIVVGLIGSVLGTVRNFEDVAWHLWHTYDPTRGYLALLFHVWVPAVWIPMLFTGLVLGGIGAVGERRMRRLGSLLLAMGTCGWVYYFTDSGSTFEARSVHVGFGLLFSLGWAVLGLMLWRNAASH